MAGARTPIIAVKMTMTELYRVVTLEKESLACEHTIKKNYYFHVGMLVNGFLIAKSLFCLGYLSLCLIWAMQCDWAAHALLVNVGHAM